MRNDFWRYDPETDSWTEIDTMPTLRRRGAFSFAINNKGYVGGGVNQNGLTDDEFWEYTPNISSVTNIEQSEKIKVFPNPVTDILKFDSNGPEIKTFSIYSVMGQLVKSGTATDHTIPVAELPEGVYVLKFFSRRHPINPVI